MLVNDFDYYLPEELIAQHPMEKRSDSRLMVLDRQSGETKEDHFYNILDYLKEGDCLVFNNTRVLPARLFGIKTNGTPVEFLLLNDLGGDLWDVIVKPGRRCKIGDRFTFGDGLMSCVVEAIDETGNRHVRFEYDGVFLEILEQVGNVPLPPYITERLEDKERYQTVYAKVPGSAAAPTAGLHFTPEILEELERRGIHKAQVTLNVGLGTFRPVKAETVEDHVMHSERFSITQEACDIINDARAKGGRIIAVGTTDVRVLESASDENGILHPMDGATSIFIYPGYKFKAVDGIITNFHLPKSTLIMLISAFAGQENVMAAYKRAVDSRFRFFSFGDSMFIS